MEFIQRFTSSGGDADGALRSVCQDISRRGADIQSFEDTFDRSKIFCILLSLLQKGGILRVFKKVVYFFSYKAKAVIYSSAEAT